MKKCLALLALLLAISGCAASEPYAPGEVYAVSWWGRNDPSSKHLMYATHGAATSVSRLDPTRLYREIGLPMFNFEDGVEIEIVGEGAGEPRFSLYHANGEEIYSGQREMVLPDETGIYFLCVELVWSDGYTRWGYQYFFCMSK